MTHVALLPSFPIKLWTHNVFKDLASLLGRFVRIEKKMLYGVEKNIAFVMVEIDITKGVPMEVKIEWGDKSFKQRLDYLQIPFQWHFCQKMSHVKARCPYFLSGTVYDD